MPLKSNVHIFIGIDWDSIGTDNRIQDITFSDSPLFINGIKICLRHKACVCKVKPVVLDVGYCYKRHTRFAFRWRQMISVRNRRTNLCKFNFHPRTHLSKPQDYPIANGYHCQMGEYSGCCKGFTSFIASHAKSCACLVLYTA